MMVGNNYVKNDKSYQKDMESEEITKGGYEQKKYGKMPLTDDERIRGIAGEKELRQSGEYQEVQNIMTHHQINNRGQITLKGQNLDHAQPANKQQPDN